MRLAGKQLVLDTNILIHVLRGQAAGRALEAIFGLQTRIPRPIIPVVVKGETKSFAKYRKWGNAKVDALDKLLAMLPSADISSEVVLDAYAELDSFCTLNGNKLGKNDAWIAAIALVTGSTILTTDKDFSFLRDTKKVEIEVLEAEPLIKGVIA